MGVLQACCPCGPSSMARTHAGIGRSVRQSLYLAASRRARHGGAALSRADAPMDPSSAGHARRRRSLLERPRLRAPAALLFRLFSTLNQSLGKPQLVTWLQLASLGVKLPLSIWFAFGGSVCRRWGWWAAPGPRSSSTTRCWRAAIWLLRSQPFYREYRFWRRSRRPTGRRSPFARLGVPPASPCWWR